jgi:hypothetical protein
MARAQTPLVTPVPVRSRVRPSRGNSRLWGPCSRRLLICVFGGGAATPSVPPACPVPAPRAAPFPHREPPRSGTASRPVGTSSPASPGKTRKGPGCLARRPASWGVNVRLPPIGGLRCNIHAPKTARYLNYRRAHSAPGFPRSPNIPRYSGNSTHHRAHGHHGVAQPPQSVGGLPSAMRYRRSPPAVGHSKATTRGASGGPVVTSCGRRRAANDGGAGHARPHGNSERRATPCGFR